MYPVVYIIPVLLFVEKLTNPIYNKSTGFFSWIHLQVKLMLSVCRVSSSHSGEPANGTNLQDATLDRQESDILK